MGEEAIKYLNELKLRLLANAIETATSLTRTALIEHRTGDKEKAARIVGEANDAYENAVLRFRLAEADGLPVAINRERLQDLKKRLGEFDDT